MRPDRLGKTGEVLSATITWSWRPGNPARAYLPPDAFWIEIPTRPGGRATVIECWPFSVGPTYRLSSTPPLTRHASDLMCCDCTLNIDKIEKELGYQPVVSVVEGLRQLKELSAA